MSLAPIRTGVDSTMVVLSFGQNENSLNNVDRIKVDRAMIHEVQTTDDVISQHLGTKDLGDSTSRWQPITYKREPKQIEQNISPIDPTPQKFDKFGSFASKYGDDCWITDYAEHKSEISFKKSVLTAMYYGFQRLQTRQAIAAMLNPVRWRYTPNWPRAEAETMVKELDNSRIVAFAVKSKGTTAADRSQYAAGTVPATLKTLAFPDVDIFLKLRRKFTDMNVPAGLVPNALLTPNMEEMLYNIKDTKDRENIFRMMQKEGREHFMWRNINWIRVTPEIAPGAFYAGKYIDVSKATVDDKVILGEAKNAADGANTIALTADNHEVIPFWFANNVWKVTDKRMDKTLFLRVPYYKNQPILIKEVNCGGSRAQDVLQLNLIVPII